MKLIIGLGNPGPKYVATRHNIGFILLDAIGERHGAWRDKFNAQTMKIKMGGEDVVLLKPQTFMNKSGISVAAAAQFYKIATQDMLVVHDELDLAPGQFKLKQGGGHAGHNGLRSIISHLNQEFARLRVGIGHPGDKAQVANFVLHDFAKSDQDWIRNLQENINSALPYWVDGNGSRFVEVLRGQKAKTKATARAPKTPAEKPKIQPETSSPFAALKSVFKKD